MLELLAVITLLGILAVAAISSMGTLSESSLVGQTEVLKRHIRYTQHRAMSTRSTWKITASKNSYSLTQTLGKESIARRFPSEQNDSRVLPDGVSFLQDWTIEFSPQGEPAVSKLPKNGRQWGIRLRQGNAERQFKLTEFTGFLTETKRVP